MRGLLGYRRSLYMGIFALELLFSFQWKQQSMKAMKDTSHRYAVAPTAAASRLRMSDEQ